MTSAKIIGVYSVPEANEACYLVELAIKGGSGVFPVVEITQEVAGEARENWQVPYAEQLLSSDGGEILSEPFEAEDDPDLWSGDFRLAFFFHHLDLSKPLVTPFGSLPLPKPSAVPSRLRDITYEAP